MLESEGSPRRTDHGVLVDIDEKLAKIYDAQMSTFVQVSRLYDLAAAYFMGETAEGFTEMLTDHKNGVLQTSLPVVHTFGAAYAEEDDDE